LQVYHIHQFVQGTYITKLEFLITINWRPEEQRLFGWQIWLTAEALSRNNNCTSVPFDKLPGKPGQAGKLPPDPMKNCL